LTKNKKGKEYKQKPLSTISTKFSTAKKVKEEEKRVNETTYCLQLQNKCTASKKDMITEALL
jgi:hypothetical protein